ncbi:3-deoxy-D-manno-octulosonic acid transferase [Robertkochia marina]|uniref:3-deoxy-D-manno-octulosonic acid transferase n=1 Tax=Robertkochia marina TaxID=1227945 RepID=A0A4S3M3Q2_9FLAO|nr:glycosyltransferase N-terminal domain-containing protein [Robertkochia marina]THD69713.1 3-deoxy-D-manno-octulosonic acid transferase [Robertkochia marina]TRZ46943.1 3-deoxy-D-manno-octulosonic acid transferase [Robertkochia marina]
MLFVYDLLVYLSGFLIKCIAFFNEKLSLFVKGRKHVFADLEKEILSTDRVIWFHTASLGEFEQGLPVIEQTKKDFPGHKIVLSFFSPSGYEVKKNTEVADVVCYLPMDTRANAKRFLDLLHPELAVFVKYEFWPNYLHELHKREINTLLISAIFRENQAFFKWYGTFMRRSLKTFTHLFVQDQGSASLLKSIGIIDVSVSGDTRFDRVHEILSRDNTLDFMEEFKGTHTLFVAGSTWPDDEAVIVPYIKEQRQAHFKYLIAPHNMKPKMINDLADALGDDVIRFSERETKDLTTAKVLILDTIGLLTRVYSYADMAYVGGGLGDTGLHNTLEPAVFGIPVIIGPNYDGFREAELLVEAGGIAVISDKKSFNYLMGQLSVKQELVSKMGAVNKEFIEKNRGAVIQITHYTRTLIK